MRKAMHSENNQPDASIRRLEQGRYFCPVALPWFRFVHEQSPVSRLRRQVFRSRQPFGRGASPLRFAKYALRWPLQAGVNAWRGAGSSIARKVTEKGGPSRPLQAWQLFKLGIGNNVSASSYYAYRLWQSDKYADADNYLQNAEGAHLFEDLHHGQPIEHLEDKTAFFQACRDADLPCIPIIAELDGKQPRWFGEAVLPAVDLFIKPPDRTSGRGASRWSYNNEQQKWCQGEDCLDQAELLAFPHPRAGSRRLIIQPVISNHRELKGFTNGALGSLRVVTYRLPGSAPGLYRSVWKMPTGNAITDNMSQGNLGAQVTPPGILGRALYKYRLEIQDSHPDTGARITGQPLAGWQGMIDLALRAHAQIGIDGILAWDIASADSGPVLIEPNPNWGVELIQVACDEPIGRTELPELLRGLGCPGGGDR